MLGVWTNFSLTVLGVILLEVHFSPNKRRSRGEYIWVWRHAKLLLNDKSSWGCAAAVSKKNWGLTHYFHKCYLWLFNQWMHIELLKKEASKITSGRGAVNKKYWLRGCGRSRTLPAGLTQITYVSRLTQIMIW